MKGQRKPVREPGLAPKHPPRFGLGDEVVLFFASMRPAPGEPPPDGRRWTVIDAEVVRPRVGSHRRGRPAWLYTLTSTRPDGSTAQTDVLQWRMRPPGSRWKWHPHKS